MNDAPPPPIHAPREWVLWGGGAVLLGAAAALSYALVQARSTGSLADAPLLLLIPLNALIVYRLGASLAKDLGRMFFYLPGTGTNPQAAVDRLLAHPGMIVSGVCFAGIMALAVWETGPVTGVERTPELRVWLSLFLFANNLIIGAVFHAIVHFWHILLKEMRAIEISVLNMSNPALSAILRVNSRLVMGTAVVSSLAVCSIPLSSFTIDPVTKLFSAFALLVVIATYAVPILPLANVLAARKAEALDRLERLIEAHVRYRSGQPPARGMPASPDDLPPLGDLIEARDIVAAIRTLPPGGQISVSAAAIVAFLSFMPTLIDYAISKLP